MFTLQDYKSLLNESADDQLFVSIYIPTQRAGNNQEDRLRYKNALSDATNQLCDEKLFPEKAMTKQEATNYLSPAAWLLENNDFWTDLSDGLVVFLKGEMMEYFTVPIKFPNFVFVGDQFYLRHLLPLLDKKNKFFILALSQNEVRFFEGRENSIIPIKIADLVPEDMEETLGVTDHEQTLQMRTAGGDGIFHGHGGKKDNKDKDLEKYLRDVDNGLMKMLFDETAPLVIYAVDYLIPMYKEISKYSNIAEEHVFGNPEHEEPRMIHERAWELVRGNFESTNKEQRDLFEQAMAEKKASFSLPHIIPAAMNGKVDTLFVDSKTLELWGEINDETEAVTLHTERKPESLCLLNKAALATFNNSGTVYNIPQDNFPKVVSQMNAIYRY